MVDPLTPRCVVLLCNDQCKSWKLADADEVDAGVTTLEALSCQNSTPKPVRGGRLELVCVPDLFAQHKLAADRMTEF